MHRVGDNTLLWGTPLSSFISLLNSSPIIILALLEFKKLQMFFSIIDGNCKRLILYFKPLSHTLSNAFDTSLSTTYTWFLLASEFAIVSCIIVRAVLVPFCGLKPCCLTLIILLSFRNAFNLPWTTLSYILPGTSSRDMGL